MTQPIHLVKVKQDHHGDIRPVDYLHCPKFVKGLKPSCVEGNMGSICTGIVPGLNIMKEMGNSVCLLECRYLIEEEK